MAYCTSYRNSPEGQEVNTSDKTALVLSAPDVRQPVKNTSALGDPWTLLCRESTAKHLTEVGTTASLILSWPPATACSLRVSCRQQRNVSSSSKERRDYLYVNYKVHWI